LLYVATTRARDRLHLVCGLAPGQPTVPPRSLIASVWPVLGEDLRRVSVPAADGRAGGESIPLLRRLAARQDAPEPELMHLPAARPAYEWAGQTAQHVGTLVHRELQSIADRNLLNRYTPEGESERYSRELALLGVPRTELSAAADRVARAVRGVLADERGRWILGPHPEARSELQLSLRAGNSIEHIRPDRTFVADGTRWIVDFKTSRHEGGSRETFLAAEQERYRAQLDRYAAALGALDARPVRVGLYFPLLAEFRDWEPAIEAAKSAPGT
jgi:ATP-dependent exoDNAse (exonuclease V) beta subunit